MDIAFVSAIVVVIIVVVVLIGCVAFPLAVTIMDAFVPFSVFTIFIALRLTMAGRKSLQQNENSQPPAAR